MSDDSTPGQEECLEIERQSQLAMYRHTQTDLDEAFQPQSKGFHELVDRAGCALEQWDQWVLNHPAAVLNQGLYQHANRVRKSIHEFYEVLRLFEEDDDYIEPPTFDDDE